MHSYSFPSFSQHDDREEDPDMKWVENRGRGRGSFLRGRARFIIRKAAGGPNTNSPKWAHDKFQVNGEQGAEQEEETEQDHKEGEIDGEHTWAVKATCWKSCFCSSLICDLTQWFYPTRWIYTCKMQNMQLRYFKAQLSLEKKLLCFNFTHFETKWPFSTCTTTQK